MGGGTLYINYIVIQYGLQCLMGRFIANIIGLYLQLPYTDVS